MLFADFRKAGVISPRPQAMLSDPDMKEFAEEEMKAARRACRNSKPSCRSCCAEGPQRRAQRHSQIRAGTGGEESALFAGNLFRMYTRYAERQRWQVEVMSSSRIGSRRLQEIIARIVGHGAYSKLKFESGGHRVQRVPGQTEAPRGASTPRPVRWP